MADDALLERAPELRTLRTVLASAASGAAGGFVAVQGGPGVGKSRLLAEARELAAAGGLRVLQARASELAGGFAFGLTRQLFDPVLSAAAPMDRVTLLAGSARPAAAVLGVRLPDGELAPGGDFAVLHGLFWLTANLAQAQPLALVCDDVHWADEPSLRFLAYLLPRLAGLGVALLIGLRPDGPGEVPGQVREDVTSQRSSRHDVTSSRDPGAAARIGRLLDQLVTDGGCQVLTPRPLSAPAAARLLAATLGEPVAPPFAAACHGAAGGNPLLLRELALAARARDIAPVADNAGLVMELGRHAVARRLELALAGFPDRRELARAVAVLAGEPPLAHAAQVAGLSPQAALVAADELAAAEILLPWTARAAELLGFVHPLQRAAVYDELTPQQRAQRHRAAAGLLTAAAAPAEQIAAHLHHVTELAAADIEVLRRAGAEALRRGAPDAALAYLQRCLDGPLAAGERLELLVAASEQAIAVEVAVAAGYLREALTLATGERQRAELTHELGRVLFGTGHAADGLPYYREALRGLPPDDADRRLRILAGMVVLRSGYLDHSPAEVAEFVDGLRDLPPVGTVGGRLLDGFIAQYDAMMCDPRALPRAFRAYQDHPMDRLAEVYPACNAGWLVRLAADLDEPWASLNAGVARCYETGTRAGLASTLGVRGLGWLWRGELAEAAADLRDGIKAAELTRQQLWAGFLRPFLAVTLAEQGRPQAAADELAAVPVPDPVPRSGSWFYSLHARAAVLLALGHPQEGLAAALAAGGSMTAHGFTNPALVPWRSEAALCLHALGRHAEGLALAGAELELATRWGAPRATGRAQRVLGLVTGGADGLDLLHAAVDTLRGSPARLEYAKALADLGAALSQDGRRAAVRGPLYQALGLADALGAAGLAGQVRAELRAAGARPRRTALSGPASLTPSERRVAELAAAGHTNRDIAQQLFVTPKTVELHLSNAYRKLGINRRDDLAAALRAPDRQQPVGSR